MREALKPDDALLRDGKSRQVRPVPEKKYCSFCGKEAAELTMLIAGPTAFICDECVATCVGVIRERAKVAKSTATNLTERLAEIDAGEPA